MPENCWKNINMTQIKNPFRFALTTNKSRIEPEPFPPASNSLLIAWIAPLALQCLPQNHLIAVAASASRCYFKECNNKRKPVRSKKIWQKLPKKAAKIKLTFFNSQIGLSGKRNNPTKFKIGMPRHSQLNWIQVVTAPRRYTNKIPMVKNSWKHVPSVPRIDVSAYSLM